MTATADKPAAKRRVSDEEVRRIHADYLRLKSLKKTAALHGRRFTTIYVLLRSRGLIKRTRTRKLPRKLVAAMLADYDRLGNVTAVAALHGRTRQAMWELLKRRRKVKPRQCCAVVREHGGKKYAKNKRGEYRLTARRGAGEQYLHRVLWIEAHGPVPPGHEIVHADGNRDNLELANLVAQPVAAASRAACLAKYGDANPSRLTPERVRAMWAAMTAEERSDRLARTIHRRHVLARERVVAERVAGVEGWIKQQANRMVVKFRGAVSFDDLAQEGRIGAMIAAQKFDPKRGHKFLTYASHWIRQKMDRFVMNCSKDVRVPAHKFWTHQTFQDSLDAPVGEDADATLGDFIGADERITEEADEADRTELLEEALAKLDERSRAVLRARFFDDQTLEQVGAAMGVTRERVRQIEFNALKRLKKFAKLTERVVL